MQIATETPTNTGPVFGRWVTEQVYSAHTSITRQTLTNWRYKDRLAGRSAALPGYPVYRKFGNAVRYWLDDGELRGGAVT